MTNAFKFQNLFYQKIIDDSNFKIKVEKYQKIDPINKSKAKSAEEKLRRQFGILITKNTNIRKAREWERWYLKFINNIAVSSKIRGREKGTVTDLIPRHIGGAWEQ